MLLIEACVWLGGIRRGEEFERTLVKGGAAFDVNRIAPGEGLPPSDGDIDVSGFELESIRATTHPLGSHQGGARTAKGIEHDIPPPLPFFRSISSRRFSFILRPWRGSPSGLTVRPVVCAMAHSIWPRVSMKRQPKRE
jgi:hypothetical protein